MKLIVIIGYVILIFSSFAYSQDDPVRKSCYQSMRYNVSVQMAGNAYTKVLRIKYTEEAFYSGGAQGISSDETGRMIAMASNNPSSVNFSYKFQDDEDFANAYMSGYLNDCVKNPNNYLSR